MLKSDFVYKKILVPLDGSAVSKRALKEAVAVAKLTKGTITLINVYSIGTSLIISSKQEYLRELTLRKAKQILAEGKKLANEEGFEVRTLLIEGDAVEQIVKTSKEGDFNLIVMGARGLGKARELILGSVSHEVIKSAPIPVLVTQ